MGPSVLPRLQGASNHTSDRTSDHTTEHEGLGERLRSRAGKGKSAAPPVCDDGCCLICFEPAEAIAEGESDLVRTLLSSAPTAGRTQCNHLYHTACLSRWLQQLQADKRPPCCAVCRHPLSMSSRRFFREAPATPAAPPPMGRNEEYDRRSCRSYHRRRRELPVTPGTPRGRYGRSPGAALAVGVASRVAACRSCKHGYKLVYTLYRHRGGVSRPGTRSVAERNRNSIFCRCMTIDVT